MNKNNKVNILKDNSSEIGEIILRNKLLKMISSHSFCTFFIFFIFVFIVVEVELFQQEDELGATIPSLFADIVPGTL